MSSESHVFSIKSRVCLSHKSNNTRWANSPIAFAQLSIFAKDVLPVCSLAIAVHFKFSNFCSYVTPCPDSYIEDFPIQNDIPEHLVWGYTCPLPTAFVLFFTGHINTHIADTPVWWSIFTHWAVRFGVLAIHQLPSIFKTSSPCA